MKKFNCPSCGAEVVFQSNVSVYSVCGYCSSMIVRRDVDVESIGTMAALPEDMSPLMIGTEGHYKTTRFHIIGRMKIGWRHGSWNEWHLFLENGGFGWLAEAQGFYAVSLEYKDKLHPETAKAISKLTGSTGTATDKSLALSHDPETMKSTLGNHLFLNNQKFKVVDIKETVCLGSEGELPFIAVKGRKTVSIDLLGHQGEFANIELSRDKIRIYVGQYLEWYQLRCEHLRILEGWQP